jgi:flagellar biosynthesis protein FlhG
MNVRKTVEQGVYQGGCVRREGVTRVLSFTSGKGGVGKTHTVINLATALTQQGASVLILDADMGLANVDVLLGLKVKRTLHDVLKGQCSLDDSIVESPLGISVIPAASGIDEVHALRGEEKMFLLEEIERVAHRFDYLLIDTPAGIGSDVMYFNSAAAEVVCVITGEPTSLTDTYALIKVLNARYGEKSISVLVNNVAAEEDALSAFGKLAGAVEKFLQIDVRFLGWVPSDAAVRDSVMAQRAVVSEYPSSRVSLALANVAKRIYGERPQGKVKGGMQFFFRQLLEGGVYGEEISY